MYNIEKDLLQRISDLEFILNLTQKQLDKADKYIEKLLKKGAR